VARIIVTPEADADSAIITLANRDQHIEGPGQAGEQIGGGVSSRVVLIILDALSDEMIAAAAQILEASPFCEIGPTSAEILAQEMLLAAIRSEDDRQQNTQVCKI